MKGILRKIATSVVICSFSFLGIIDSSEAREKEIKFLFPEPFSSAHIYPEGQAVGFFWFS